MTKGRGIVVGGGAILLICAKNCEGEKQQGQTVKKENLWEKELREKSVGFTGFVSGTGVFRPKAKKGK